MPTISQNQPLLKELLGLVAAHRSVLGQERVYRRVLALVLAEIMGLGRHTLTQLLLTLGLGEGEWSSWYRLFSQGRFLGEAVSGVLLGETLQHVGSEDLYVVVGDGTQTPRSSRKMEGVGWLRNLRSPAFKVGIHLAQRWFNGAWLMPPEQGYSRAMPLLWLPAFTAKSTPKTVLPCTEWEAAIQFLKWLQQGLAGYGRGSQRVLMLGDGSYDSLEMWRHLPSGVVLLARSAKNRVLYHLPTAQHHRGRKYGERAATPQQVWQGRSGWKHLPLTLRGQTRTLRYQVIGPVVRQGLASHPLILIVVAGQTYLQHGHRKHRDPLPYLVNAHQDNFGQWILPLPIETLLFWAWQRWEVEVCHRELKSNFGLGQKQCHNPHAAIASVQWSAWVYALALLAAYRTWGLCQSPDFKPKWWRGSRRWSFNTLWRAFRAELWNKPAFRPLWAGTTCDWGEKDDWIAAQAFASYTAAHL